MKMGNEDHLFNYLSSEYFNGNKRKGYFWATSGQIIDHDINLDLRDTRLIGKILTGMVKHKLTECKKGRANTMFYKFPYR